MKEKKQKPILAGNDLRTAAAVTIGMGTELPADAISSTPHFELIGNNEFVADGVKELVGCTDAAIAFECARIKVRVSGAGLCIRDYLGERIVITGIITDVSFT